MPQRAWRKHRKIATSASQKLADLEAELQEAEAAMLQLQGRGGDDGGDDDGGDEDDSDGDEKSKLTNVVRAVWSRNTLRCAGWGWGSGRGARGAGGWRER